jgi:hypothetical protein
VGDCNDDGTVTLDELIRAVHIALGIRLLDDCEDVDEDGDGVVSIVELIAASRAVLAGSCA